MPGMFDLALLGAQDPSQLAAQLAAAGIAPGQVPQFPQVGNFGGLGLGPEPTIGTEQPQPFAQSVLNPPAPPQVGGGLLQQLQSLLVDPNKTPFTQPTNANPAAGQGLAGLIGAQPPQIPQAPQAPQLGVGGDPFTGQDNLVGNPLASATPNVNEFGGLGAPQFQTTAQPAPQFQTTVQDPDAIKAEAIRQAALQQAGAGGNVGQQLGKIGQAAGKVNTPTAPPPKGGVSGAAQPARAQAFKPGQGTEGLLQQLLQLLAPVQSPVPTLGQVAFGR